MDSTISRDMRKFELRDSEGKIIETDLYILQAKDRQNILWKRVRTTIFVVGSNEKVR